MPARPGSIARTARRSSHLGPWAPVAGIGRCRQIGSRTEARTLPLFARNGHSWAVAVGSIALGSWLYGYLPLLRCPVVRVWGTWA